MTEYADDEEAGAAGAVRAPFPWFGGKSRVAAAVWERLGNPGHYIEPFAGSLAVLLARPTAPGVETVNDMDGYLSNFWRAVRADPDAVAEWADYPVIEQDLHARHKWLVNEVRARLAGISEDPERYDPQVAGWWLWGICAWIGGGWCSGVDWRIKPYLSGPGMGIHGTERLDACSPGRKPGLAQPGRGIHADRAAGREDGIRDWMRALARRLRRVRVCCGDWGRVVTPAVLSAGSPAAVFLDPPYDTALRDDRVYATDTEGVSERVRAWALAHGEDPGLRIALCGYEGEHAMPETWECYAWATGGGYASLGDRRGKENRHKERIWFSPGCIRPQPGLFG